jgi:hypothetical protein
MTARAGQATLPWTQRRLLRVPLIYAPGIDRRDWQVVRSCFAADAYVQGTRTTAASMSTSRSCGRDPGTSQ